MGSETGEIIFGIVKKAVGASQGSLALVIFWEKGPEAARMMFAGIQMVVKCWLSYSGFGIGIGDVPTGRRWPVRSKSIKPLPLRLLKTQRTIA